ncbi:outer membrane beta-barrel protein [Sphingobacterium sp.]|uniref:outer membrane beta-barrel protein n=1 Tax=Sphingobacterium sp. TaxID=341027 RepID=UPI0028A0644B|nr:outer membrane beta-barrel protein [Sphingobacterium sp.]
MHNLYYILTVLMVCLSISPKLHAQEGARSIEGLVVDTIGMGLKGVSVRLSSTADTIVVTTNANGFYRINKIKGEHISVTYSMLGHQIVKKTFPSNRFIDQIFAPKVTLHPQANIIPEVRVVKYIPIVNKGDTVQFNMKAFSFPERSLLEEALKNIPGFQVLRDGTLFYNGQIITQVQVDGRKFFGGDVQTATRNLPAEFVKQIEVINDYGVASTEKGIKNNEPEKIININLEENKKKITFGQGTIGGGTRERYLGSLGINKFNDGQEVSVVGSLNNTNTSLFAFGSPNGAGGRATSLGEFGDYADQSDGLNKLGSIGVSFTDNWGKDIQISGGYNYQSRQNLTEGNSLLTSSFSNFKIHKKEDYSTTTLDNYHKLFFEINSKFKNQDIFKIKPTITYNRTFVDNNKYTTRQNYRVSESGEQKDSSVNSTPTAEVLMFYSKYFKKPGRKLIGDFRFNFQTIGKDERVNESYVIYDTTSVNPSISMFEQEQIVDARNDLNTIKSSISYVEPFLKHSLLEVSYDIDITDIEARRVVRKEPFEIIDSLGVEYAYQFRSFKTGLNYQYEPNNRFRVNLGFSVQPLSLEGKVKGDTATYNYSNVNLIPTTNIRYKVNDELDLQFSYLGKNNQPNFLHISPVRDNSNSRNIIVGNPALKAEFYNKISTSLRKFVTNRGQYFETSFAYTFINNKIVSTKKSVSKESTIQETSFENTNGYYDVRWNYLFNTPFINDNFQLDLNGDVEYYNNLSFIDSRKSTTRQVLFNQNLQFRYNWNEYFESVFNTNYFLNRAIYELPYRNKIAAHSFLLSLGGKGYISNKFVLGAEMSQRFYKGYVSELSDVNPTIINTYLEYTFMKNNLALLRLQCYDLLDQNKNVGVLTEYAGNDVFESRNNRLGRYLMLTLNIRLQSYPNKK